MRNVLAQHEAWTPDYVATMPLDQLIAWSTKGPRELTREEAAEHMRKKREEEAEEE